jgi:hypothetical protein
MECKLGFSCTGCIFGGSARIACAARMRSSSMPMRDMRMPVLNLVQRGVKTLPPPYMHECVDESIV